MTPLERFEDALRAAGCREGGRRGAWTCPAHDDSNPSLSVREGDDGRVLVNCFGGCGVEQVVARIGLRVSDLRPPGSGATVQHPEDSEQRRGDECCSPQRNGPATVQRSPAPDCTLEAYAAAKGLSTDYLMKLGIREIPYQGGRALRIPYLDEAGEEQSIRFRLRVEKLEGGDGRFKWRTGSKAIPYGLWRLNLAQATGAIVLVEGESDSHVLWMHGIPALGIPGANNWKSEFAGVLEGIGTIFAVRETDHGGAGFVAALLRDATLRDRLRVVDLGAKDVGELYLRDPGDFERAFAAALDRSTVAVEEQRAQAEAESLTKRDEAWQACAELAKTPSILDRFAEQMEALGAVGEERAAKLLFLAITSRLFARPVSVVVKGPSSAGKSFTTEQTLRFFPSSTYYSLSGMSERFLIYDPEPLAHRMIVVSEAAGLVGDFATYLVRTLLSEGRLIYGTTEKTEDGTIQGRRIEKPGPTGVILTTTQIRLHPENETRLFSIPVDDTQEQTRRVLLSIAADGSEGDRDFAAWHALQDWLALGEVRVVVPFAKALANEIPAVAVRLRRDFGALLSLIRAHALLHRATRQATDRGIVATLDDYQVVRELVLDVMGEAAQVGVTPAIRTAVELVKALIAAGTKEVSIRAVAKGLKLDKASASRRCRAAIEAGYLVNLEDTKGKPARIVLGDDLPDPRELLPEPEALQWCEPLQEGVHHSNPRNGGGNADRCTVAGDSGGVANTHTQPRAFKL